MKDVRLRLVYDRHGRGSRKVAAPVSVEVYCGRSRRWFGTGVKVFSDQWRDGRVVRHFDSQSLNDAIDAEYMRLSAAVRSVCSRGAFSFEALDAELSGDAFGDFLSFCERRIRERVELSEGTRKHHAAWLRVMKSWGVIRSFSDLTVENIHRYDAFVHSRGISQQTVYNYHKWLKSYINQAIAFGRIDKSPYLGQHFSRGKSSARVYLTESELSRLRASEMPSASLERVRDLFVFQCYTGMSYSDLRKFDFGKAEDRCGKWFVHDVRTKTGEDFYLVLLKPAVAVLERYGWVLPIVSAAKYNQYIKQVAACCGINKSLTSHCARHTFAVYALNRGIAVEVLAKMLGHSDIKTTQIYAKIVQKSLTDAFERLETE